MPRPRRVRARHGVWLRGEPPAALLQRRCLGRRGIRRLGSSGSSFPAGRTEREARYHKRRRAYGKKAENLHHWEKRRRTYGKKAEKLHHREKRRRCCTFTPKGGEVARSAGRYKKKKGGEVTGPRKKAEKLHGHEKKAEKLRGKKKGGEVTEKSDSEIRSGVNTA